MYFLHAVELFFPLVQFFYYYFFLLLNSWPICTNKNWRRKKWKKNCCVTLFVWHIYQKISFFFFSRTLSTTRNHCTILHENCVLLSYNIQIFSLLFFCFQICAHFCMLTSQSYNLWDLTFWTCNSLAFYSIYTNSFFTL